MSCPCTCTQNIPVPLPSASGEAGASAAVEALCQQSMSDCTSCCYTDTRNCPGGCTGEPLAMTEPRGGSQVRTQRCCDQNGCCGIYLACCRDPFWPSFSHPSWLCCRDLYRQ